MQRSETCSLIDHLVGEGEQCHRISLSLSPGYDSIFHLKDRKLVATAGLVDDRGLDAGDPGPARELVEGEVLQMLVSRTTTCTTTS